MSVQFESARRSLRTLRTEFFVARRLLLAPKRRSVNVITAVAMVGVVIGVAALVAIIGITSGFQDEFERRILGLYPHVLILHRGGHLQDYRRLVELTRSTPGVAGASPAAFSQMLAATPVGRRAAVAVRGVDATSARRVIDVQRVMDEAVFASLDDRPHVVAKGSEVRVTGAVEGSHWTVGLGADGRAVAVADVPVEPPPEGHRIRLLHLAAGTPAAFRLEAGATRGNPVRFGESSDVLDVPPSVERLSVVPSQGSASIVELSPDAPRALDVLLLDAGTSRGVVTVVAPAPLAGATPTVAAKAFVRLAVAAGSAGAVRLDVPGSTPVGPGDVGTWNEVDAHPAALVLGEVVARRLGVSTGDIVALVSPLRGGLVSGLGPRSGRFVVTGTFHSGYYEYDSRVALTDLHSAQRVLGRGDVASWIDVRLGRGVDLDAAVGRLRRRLEPYCASKLRSAVRRLDRAAAALGRGEVAPRLTAPDSPVAWLDNVARAMRVLSRRDLRLQAGERLRFVTWRQMNENLLGALKLQKVVLTVLFLIIVAVAAFNLVGSQVMLVHDKRSDIAILEAMGMSRRRVLRVFFYEGLATSALGALVGLVVGLGLIAWLRALPFPLDPAVYLIDHLPASLHPAEAVVVALLATAVTAAATLYAAVRAARVRPAEGLRYIE